MKTMMILAGVLGLAGFLRVPEDGGDPADLLKKTGLTLSEAIAKATVIAKQGTVVEAELEEEDGKVIYSISFAQGNKVFEVNLDAKSGEQVGTETENEDESATAQALKITVTQAIEAALQKKPGLAFNAAAELEDGKPEVEVKILSEGKVYKVEVDGVTGVAGTPKLKKAEKKEKEEEKDEKK